MAVPAPSDPSAQSAEKPFVERRRASREGLKKLNSLAEQTGQSIVNLSGNLQQIDADASAQLTIVEGLADQAQSLTQTTHVMTDGLGEVTRANANAMETVDGSVETLKRSAECSKDVATWVGDLDGALGAVESTLAEVNRANLKISEIAKQVNILAVNARIEAARAGDAGRGFAVVAEAINLLSKQTSDAASDVRTSTQTLQVSIGDLRKDANGMSDSANEVLEGSAHVDKALVQINEDVRAAVQGAEGLTDTVQNVADAVEHFAPAFETLTRALKATAAGVRSANTRAEEIVDISENAVQVSVELGADNADAALIELVQDRATMIGDLFDKAIASGKISTQALFDSTYSPIPNTVPQQVMARFTRFTDSVLPAVQEPVLTLDPRIVFCAAVDKNGYLPTHNRKFSAPQSSDEVWNAAHCRNRRIFDDRVGLKSGQNTAPFLMQTYRRDMGGGQFVLMKDISAPIMVQGRHWGGFRMGVAQK
ncbi:methyl-accepting chemotaxis protein [Jannaschia sp. CCS1]|uniref:methyl-accepting chemotaxis protein n=1 Tax=Jannaschia sp. (strain CCS1) TaxID=290400 RepID=UPI00006C0032|nr:methyl-accepting chemotaxis protein [Jannaschia sp. CCS1]ABD55144.1 methyl-accepting chemotaxis sensory transducer [Jannaschia sp. CCS1]